MASSREPSRSRHSSSSLSSSSISERRSSRSREEPRSAPRSRSHSSSGSSDRSVPASRDGTRTLKLKRFNAEQNLTPGKRLLIVGKSNSGKSTLELYVLYLIRRLYDIMVAFCPTPEMREKLALISDSAHVGEEYNEEVVQNCLNTGLIMKENGTPKSILITMDDCGFDKKIFTSKTFRELAKNGRNLGPVGFIVLLQYLMDMPSDIRSQIDIVMVLAENILKNRERLWTYFFGVFPDKNLFDRVMQKVTDNYGVLVLDNTVRSNQIKDCVFVFKAKLPIPKFRIGGNYCRTLEQRYCFDNKSSERAREAYREMQKQLRDKKMGKAPGVGPILPANLAAPAQQAPTRGRTKTTVADARRKKAGASEVELDPFGSSAQGEPRANPTQARSRSRGSTSSSKRKVASPMIIEFEQP